jgi:hypothetical protein
LYVVVFRIRIGSLFNQVSGSGSGSWRAKITHKIKKCFSCKFLYIFDHQNPVSGSVFSLKALDPDQVQMNMGIWIEEDSQLHIGSVDLRI